MRSRLSKPMTPLVAYLASLAILLGPVASFGTCCCSRAAAAAAEAAPAQAQVGSCCSAVSRPAGNQVATGSCCSGFSQTACTEPVAPLPVTPLQGPCQCEDTCCDALLPDTTAIIGPAAEQRGLSSDGAPLLGILDRVDWHLESVVIAPHREPITLSAQDHCALLCRWLN